MSCLTNVTPKSAWDGGRAEYDGVMDPEAARESAVAETTTGDVVATLVENHRQFLRFVEKRVGSRAAAAYELELRGEVCACITRLLPVLKPEYAEMIRRVDLDEQPVSGVARSLGITANNAQWCHSTAPVPASRSSSSTAAGPAPPMGASTAVAARRPGARSPRVDPAAGTPRCGRAGAKRAAPQGRTRVRWNERLAERARRSPRHL